MMRQKSAVFLLFLLFLSFPSLLSAQSVRVPETPAQLNNTLWAYSVQDADTGEQLIDLRAHTLMTPASTLKLVSTATAMEVLGPDYRIKTSLRTEGTVVDGTLEGNLYIVGAGDPSLGSKYLWREDSEQFFKEATSALQQLGIRRISGSVLALKPWTDFQAVNPRWPVYDTGNYYASGAYDLNLYDNTYTVTITQNGKQLSVNPSIPDLNLKAVYSISDTRSGDSLFISPNRDAEGHTLITGAYPGRAPRRTVRGAIPDPPLFFARHLRDVLVKGGISVAGEAAAVSELPEENLSSLYEYASKPLQELVSTTNVYSHNLYAESILRLLGREQAVMPGHNHTQRSIMTVYDYWERRGMNMEELEMLDGCGLSPENKVTPYFLTTMLGKIHRGDPSRSFARTLPRAGKEGTMSQFLKKTKLEDAARLKSGTLRNVVCYAGYVYVGDKTYTVAVMVNNYYGRYSDIRRGLEQLLLDTFVR